jgi:hypothetical protein
MVVSGAILYLHRTHLLLEKIMIDGFVNRTGDPVFDETIRQGLAIQLEQSPMFLVTATITGPTCIPSTSEEKRIWRRGPAPKLPQNFRESLRTGASS